MKNLLLILVLSFLSIQSFAAGCPDGSEPVKSVSADGTYFVYNCAGQEPSSNNTVTGLIKASDINFPGDFYTSKIASCEAIGPNSFNSSSSTYKVEGLVGYDWHADWEANSTSISPKHDNITGPIKLFMSATHNAIGNDNKDNIKTAKNLLIELAKANTLYDSIGYNEVKKKPDCYANGDETSPCWYHEYSFARGVFSNYMIAALWLRDELSEKEFEIVDQYINKMYKKFLEPTLFKEEEKGFYDMANGGMSILVFASWTNNKKLAAQEINFRFKEMNRLFYEDGYINNNSFRGVRAQWYHSYGLDIALGYAYIADLWGAKVPKNLYNKLVKASEVANLAINDWEKFKSRKYSGIQENEISGKDNAIKHTHQSAIALDTLMKIVTGIELANDPMYLKKRKFSEKDGIDDLIGFNPNCTVQALAKKNKIKEAKISLKVSDSNTINITTSDSDPTVSKVIEVIQGDKFIFDIAKPHELAGSNLSVGLLNLDAPDATRSCPKQLEFGEEVRDFVAQKLNNATSIKLTNFRKTNIKIIADVIVDGIDLGDELLSKGFVSDEYGYWQAYFCSALLAINSGKAYNLSGDYEKSIFWYERALILDPDGSNNSQATFDLFKLYDLKGENNMSLAYLKQSAGLGYMQAEEALGKAYIMGYGVSKNKSEGKKWLKKAHEHGSKAAEGICGCEF